MTEPILILTTGGTIDKVYFDDRGAYAIGDSLAAEIFETAQVAVPVRIAELMRKDSLDLADSDRAAIRDAVIAAPERCVVITHGSDTMVATAAALAGAAPDKTVVLVGALSPARFAKSDATFNLGMALAAAQLASPGVHIAMNGTIFAGDKVRKDLDLNRFVAV